MHDVYTIDFEKFLSLTDEKAVFLQEISREILQTRIKTLLDIGAGNGLLSIPLAQTVERYVAVEAKKEFAEILRNAGLCVIEKRFPCDIHTTFSMVLSCHSLSYAEHTYESFIRAAWDATSVNGVLLLVSHKGQEDEWTHLMNECGLNFEDRYRVGFHKVVELLYSLGEVTIRKVVTHVRTDTLPQMLEALSFVASDGVPERKEEFYRHEKKDWENSLNPVC